VVCSAWEAVRSTGTLSDGAVTGLFLAWRGPGEGDPEEEGAIYKVFGSRRRNDQRE